MRNASGEKEEEEIQPERPGGASVVSGSPGHDPGTCQAMSHDIVLHGILLGVCLGWQLVNRLALNEVLPSVPLPHLGEKGEVCGPEGPSLFPCRFHETQAKQEERLGTLSLVARKLWREKSLGMQSLEAFQMGEVSDPLSVTHLGDAELLLSAPCPLRTGPTRCSASLPLLPLPKFRQASTVAG